MNDKKIQTSNIVIYSAFQKTRFIGHLWSKMELLQITIKYLKSLLDRILIFRLQIDLNQIFELRHYKTFNENM